MANIDDIAYAIGADKKNPTGIKDWFGRVVSLSPFKVARLGSEIGVECVNLAVRSYPVFKDRNNSFFICYFCTELYFIFRQAFTEKRYEMRYFCASVTGFK